MQTFGKVHEKCIYEPGYKNGLFYKTLLTFFTLIKPYDYYTIL